MGVRITAEQIVATDLKPGDLFSIAGQIYWDRAMTQGSCGECVYIRTNTPADRFEDANTTVYRITIERTPDADV